MTEHFMDRTNKTGRKYPFPDMEVGDHFVFPLVYKSLVQSSIHWNKRQGFGNFKIEQVSKNECFCIKMDRLDSLGQDSANPLMARTHKEEQENLSRPVQPVHAGQTA
jgi:hypothetical protein